MNWLANAFQKVQLFRFQICLHIGMARDGLCKLKNYQNKFDLIWLLPGTKT